MSELGPTSLVPDVAPPVENPAPVQESAPVELQVRSEVPPSMMLDGSPRRVAVGSGLVTVTVTLLVTVEPSFPIQLSV